MTASAVRADTTCRRRRRAGPRPGTPRRSRWRALRARSPALVPGTPCTWRSARNRAAARPRCRARRPRRRTARPTPAARAACGWTGRVPPTGRSTRRPPCTNVTTDPRTGRTTPPVSPTSTRSPRRSRAPRRRRPRATPGPAPAARRPGGRERRVRGLPGRHRRQRRLLRELRPRPAPRARPHGAGPGPGGRRHRPRTAPPPQRGRVRGAHRPAPRRRPTGRAGTGL